MTAGYATISADNRSDWQKQQAKQKAEQKQLNKNLHKNQHLWNFTSPFVNFQTTENNASQVFNFTGDVTKSMVNTGLMASQAPALTQIWKANPTLWGKTKGLMSYYLPEEVIGGVGAGAGAAVDGLVGGDGSTGAFVGGLIGVSATNPILGRARKAAYRHITPLGYNDATGLGLGKKQEIINALKETLLFGKPQPTEGVVVPWIANLDVKGNLSNLYNSRTGMTPNAFIRFRDQAWRKAMRQPELDFEPQIYRDNGDGTFSYDLDAVNKIRRQSGSTEITNPSAKDLKTTYAGKEYNADVITQNGGFVGVTKDKSGNEYMYDIWDLQPFKDDYRSLWPWGTKNLPFIKNIEAVDALRGNPFVVKHKLE